MPLVPDSALRNLLRAGRDAASIPSWDQLRVVVQPTSDSEGPLALAGKRYSFMYASSSTTHHWQTGVSVLQTRSAGRAVQGALIAFLPEGGTLRPLLTACCAASSGDFTFQVFKVHSGDSESDDTGSGSAASDSDSASATGSDESSSTWLSCGDVIALMPVGPRAEDSQLPVDTAIVARGDGAAFFQQVLMLHCNCVPADRRGALPVPLPVVPSLAEPTGPASRFKLKLRGPVTAHVQRLLQLLETAATTSLFSMVSVFKFGASAFMRLVVPR